MTSKRLWLAGLAVFVMLSLTDYVQTYALITDNEGAVYEANPVANAWLELHGWSGLAAFKFGVVAVFAGAAAILVSRRPRAGVGVMALGCLTLLAVTLYSSRLIAETDHHRAVPPRTVVVCEPRFIPAPIDPDSDLPPSRRGLPSRQQFEAE